VDEALEALEVSHREIFIENPDEYMPQSLSESVEISLETQSFLE